MPEHQPPRRRKSAFASSALPGVSIIIPTLNEAENLPGLVSEILTTTGPEVEILIADGASEDNTPQVVAALATTHPVRLVPCTRAQGLAGAVWEGAREAKNEILVIMDADHSHPPQALLALLAPLLAREKELVFGSRYIPGGSTPGWSPLRRLCSRAAGVLAWPLTDLHDPMSGYFAIRREHLLEADVQEVQGYKIGLQLAMHGEDRWRVGEVPIAFRERAQGQSKMRVEVILHYLQQLLLLAGGVVSGKTLSRFGLVGILGMLLDVSLFQFLLWNDTPLGSAHVLSFVAATVFNFTLNKTWAFPRSNIPRMEGKRAYLRFLSVCLLALFVRGGLLGVFTHWWGWPPLLAVVAAIGPAAAVNYLGSALYVFPSGAALKHPVRRWKVGAVAVIGYCLLLRLIYLGLYDLLPQEAYYWNYAQHPDIGYLDHPPMVAWLIWLGEALLGRSELAVRSGAVVCALISAGFIYAFARNLFGKLEGLLSVMLLGAIPLYFAQGYFIVPDTPLVAAWAGALFFFERALLGGRRGAWWGAGCCVGVGLLSKYTMVLIGLPALAFVLVDARSRSWLKGPTPYGAALLAFALFSPVVIWNVQNDWISFWFQTGRRIKSFSGVTTLWEFSLMALPLLTPMFLVALWLGRPHAAHAEPATTTRKRWFMLCFTLLPLGVFIGHSLVNEARFYWSSPLWLAVIPLVAWSIGKGLTGGGGLLGRMPGIWRPGLMGLMLSYGAGLHYLVLGLPGLSYHPEARVTMNWRELGRQVHTMEEALRAGTGKSPWVIGMDTYFISSELAFYQGQTPPNRIISAAHLVGSQSLMFMYWFPEPPPLGTPIIMVSREPTLLYRYDHCFSNMEPAQVLKTHRNQLHAGSYHSRIGYWAGTCKVRREYGWGH